MWPFHDLPDSIFHMVTLLIDLYLSSSRILCRTQDCASPDEQEEDHAGSLEDQILQLIVDVSPYSSLISFLLQNTAPILKS